MSKRIYKDEKNKKILGVCAGLADYFQLDPTLVRIGWVIITLLFFGAGIIIYFACGFIFPDKSTIIENNSDNKEE